MSKIDVNIIAMVDGVSIHELSKEIFDKYKNEIVRDTMYDKLASELMTICNKINGYKIIIDDKIYNTFNVLPTSAYIKIPEGLAEMAKDKIEFKSHKEYTLNSNEHRRPKINNVKEAVNSLPDMVTDNCFIKKP